MALRSAVFPVLDVVAPILLIGAISLLVIGLAPKGGQPPDEGWKGGVFYSNPRDRSLLVPKRCGVGYTLNFSNPWAWAFLALIVLVAIAPFFLTMTFLHHLRR